MTQQTGYHRPTPGTPYRQIYRSRYDRKLAGVCGGIAEYFRVDPTLVRLVAVVAAIVTGGAGLLAYGLAWIIMPEGPAGPTWDNGPQPGWDPHQPQDTP
jgi:phage shock protein C